MKKTIIVPGLVLALSVLGAFALVATAPSVENKTPERALSAVRVRAPIAQDLQLRVRSQGTVAPRTESALVPEVAGRVIWVSPSLVSGGFFAEGDPLLRIEPRSFELAVARAEASLARARSEVTFAVDELERQQGLADRNVASPAVLSAARRAEQVAKANLTDAQVALDQAQWDLERSELRAPFSGRVRSEQIDVGQVVGPNAPVATLYATDYAEIRLPIPDHQLAYLDLPLQPSTEDEAGPGVELRARFAGRDHLWRGHVVRTEGEIDLKSRMVHVVARVEDPYGVNPENKERPALAVGLFVHAEIEGPVAENVIVVPRHAMRDNDQIVVVDREDRLRIREVDVLRIDGEDVLIRSRLAPGERLCVSPLQVAIDGMKVLPVEDDAAVARGSRS
ncbi:MAG: efflux RND transporter periplasmic adaptor subunit [Myxococcota bacterium]|jgi:RND family efflux transporter MFP subunit|nr:efflux RND transporter periplasmic adaptor subunit [Myxococcota bacterium]